MCQIYSHGASLGATGYKYITGMLIVLCFAASMIGMASFKIDMIKLQGNKVLIYHSICITTHTGLVKAANAGFFDVHVYPVHQCS